MNDKMTLKIWLDGQWRDLMTFAPSLYPQVRDGAREFADMTSCNLIIVERCKQGWQVFARYWGTGLPVPLGGEFVFAIGDFGISPYELEIEDKQ